MKSTLKIARLRLLTGLLFSALLVFAGCGGGKSEEQESGHGAADAPPAASTAGDPRGQSDLGKATLAGVSFLPPTDWRDLGPDGMRKAQYRIDPVGDDTAEGEVNVYYFGPKSGGGVEANFQRWIGQMVLPEGADPTSAIQRSTFTTDSMAGHVVSLDGSYKSGGGRPMGGGGEVLPGYRLVGVVIEGPQGSVFFKLTGPEATARVMETRLMTMVKTARK